MKTYKIFYKQIKMFTGQWINLEDHEVQEWLKAHSDFYLVEENGPEDFKG